MNITGRLSLQQRFILVTSVAIIVLMSAIGYMTVVRERQIMYSEIEKQGRILVETLAIPVINDLIYEKLGLVEEGGLIDNYITEIFKKKQLDLLYLAVLDKDGRVISHNDFAEYGKFYDDPLTLKALKADRTIVQRFTDKKTGFEAMDFATPLSIGKKRWGTLKFGVSLRKVREEISDVIERVVVLTLFVLAGGFVIILLLSRQFLRPIAKLARAMEQVGAGNLDVRVEVKGNDEIALLEQSFNSMIERIKEANLQLRKTHEKLLQSEKLASIGILASGVAHEINNPLAGLFNCVDMLERYGDDRQFRKRYLKLLKDGLGRIDKTVGRLLWMSRPDSRKPEPINLRRAIQDAYDFVEYTIKKGGINFIVEADDELTLTIDPHDFQQILINLIINSIQAMPRGGTIQVEALRDSRGIIIRVSDTGIGIEKKDLGRIFDPFFTTKQAGEGTGLGLWLTYEIVKHYGGDILVESEKGKGTIFILLFPEQEGPSSGLQDSGPEQ